MEIFCPRHGEQEALTLTYAASTDSRWSAQQLTHNECQRCHAEERADIQAADPDHPLPQVARASADGGRHRRSRWSLRS